MVHQSLKTVMKQMSETKEKRIWLHMKFLKHCSQLALECHEFKWVVIQRNNSNPLSNQNQMNTSIIVNLNANGLQLLNYPTNKVSVHKVLYKDTLQCKQNTSYPHNIKTGKQHFQLKLIGGKPQIHPYPTAPTETVDKWAMTNPLTSHTHKQWEEGMSKDSKLTLVTRNQI